MAHKQVWFSGRNEALPKMAQHQTMNTTPTHVGMIGNCPHCGESIRVILSKKDVKIIYKSFKLPRIAANLNTEVKLHLQK